MRDLANAIENASDPVGYTGDETAERELRRAASAWAEYALDTFDGELLGKALAISKALAEFCNEMEKPHA
jgi:hypothetical protein